MIRFSLTMLCALIALTTNAANAVVVPAVKNVEPNHSISENR